MTVQELIDKLKEYPQDADVRINTMNLNKLYEENTRAVYYIRQICDVWENKMLGIVNLEAE